MRKHIALAWKIDAKHRSRQHLGYRAFGNDLFFLRHRAANIRASARRSRRHKLGSARASPARFGALAETPPTSLVLINRRTSESSRSRGRDRQHARRVRSPDQSTSRVTELFQRKRWQIFAKLFTFPPRARLAKFVSRCKSIAIEHRTNVMRWFFTKGIVCQQIVHVVRALQ